MTKAIMIQGTGSNGPAEVNLRAGDIANMGFAEAANVPVVLVGDIHRGGVIAQLVGTDVILPPEDAARIKGFAVNKFHGDVTLFDEGITTIEAHTGWASLGVIPHFADAWRLPAEDVMDIRSHAGGSYKVAVPRLSRIMNFDDLDPLSAEPNVSVEIIEQGRPLPGDADLVLVPGSKSTIADLAYFRAQGWDVDLHAHLRRGGDVLGICAGYQMLGRTISDPHGIEGAPVTVDGLGLLEVDTVMEPRKTLERTQATHLASGAPVQGYEIHLGVTTGPGRDRPFLSLDGAPEGAMSADGRVRGTYLHGLFSSDAFRAAFLGAQVDKGFGYDTSVERTLDALAAHLETHMDVDRLLALADTVTP